MQTTSATWKALWAAGAPLEARVRIGGETRELASEPVIVRAAMPDSLSVGNAVSASLLLEVRGGGSVPRAAEVAVEARLNDGETASEWLPEGTFYIARRSRDPVTGVLALECYDALLKANAVWTPPEGAWPREMAAVAEALAALLGVEPDARNALPTGADYVLEAPEAGTTIREVLAQIGQACGGNWVVTPENRLRLVPLAADGAEPVAVEGVLGGIGTGASGVVTGLRNAWGDETALIGTAEGIVLDVAVKPAIAEEVAEALLGIAHRPYSLAGAVFDPAAELGDPIQYGADLAGTLWTESVTLGPAFRGDISAPEAGELADEYPYIGRQDQAARLLRAQVQDLAESAVAGTAVLYAAGDSRTQPPEEGWSTVPPERAEGRFIWQKVATTYANGAVTESAPVNISGADGEPATVLRIDSSRGTVFKNNLVSTVLSVAIYRGGERITDMDGLRRVFGSGATLQWSWQRLDEDRFGVISASDARISGGGFALTLSPEDVDTKVTFMCGLIVN